MSHLINVDLEDYTASCRCMALKKLYGPHLLLASGNIDFLHNGFYTLLDFFEIFIGKYIVE